MPLEEADQEEADTGAVVVEGDDEEVEADDEADDTFLEPDEDEEGDDVGTSSATSTKRSAKGCRDLRGAPKFGARPDPALPSQWKLELRGAI